MKSLSFRNGAGFLAILLVTNIHAAVINNCDEASLRTAMAAAAADGLIIFNCDGTIVLGSPLVVTADTVLDAREHNVVISGNDAVKLFIMTTDHKLTFYNLTLTRGRDQGTNGAVGQPGGAANGGALSLQAGQLRAEGCRFTGNRAFGGKGGDGNPGMFVPAREGGNARGGAIFAEHATVILSNCIFEANGSAGGAGGASQIFGGPVIFAAGGTGDGGAIWINGGNLIAGVCQFDRASAINLGGGIYLTASEGAIERCAFNQNSAGAGGAVYCSGPQSNQRFSITQCAFQDNATSSRGGAILHANGNLNVAGCTFNGNSAVGPPGGTDGRNHWWNGGDGKGGGICSVGGDLLLRESTFLENVAAGGAGFMQAMPGSGRGGGIFAGTQMLAQNCTLAHNRAVAGEIAFVPNTSAIGEGGGICATGGTIRVSFSTIASNAVSGPTNSTVRGAGYSNSDATLILESSIFSGNTTNGGFGGNGFGPVAGSAGGVNLSSDGSVPFSHVDTDPRIMPLADNGGPVPTMALRRDSPAIDASTSPNRPLTDARGVRRPQRAQVDIGAYEQTFMSIARSAGGVRIGYDAPPMEQYALESSLDLVDWDQAQTGRSDDSGRLIFDVPPPLLPAQNYRVRLVP